VAEILDIPVFQISGCEADDVIGTIVTKMDGKAENIIVTGDMDTLQLVNDYTKVYTMSRGLNDSILYDAKQVVAKYGLNPDQIIEYKALAGDQSDNIPGIRGIGDKTAVRLLQSFGTAENIFEAIKNPETLTEEQKKLLKPKVLENLGNGYEDMVMSRQLATIDTHAPIQLVLDDCVVKDYDKKKVSELFDELDFKSLVGLLPKDQFEDSVQAALF
jgi:DNA polymerase-1